MSVMLAGGHGGFTHNKILGKWSAVVPSADSCAARRALGGQHAQHV